MEVNTLKVVDNYKKLTIFEEEVTKASAYTNEYSFSDCKAKIKKLFLDLDLSKVIFQKEKVVEEGEIWEEHAKEVMTEEVAPTIAKETLAGEVIYSTDEPH